MSDKPKKSYIERFNDDSGDLEGYDCKICHNKGVVMYEKDVVKPCECMKIRATLKAVEESGLKDVLSQMKFSTYNATTDWQKQAKELAMKYCKEHKNDWFIACGQPGSGKTHLCVAIAGQLIKQRYRVHYALWRDTIMALKANVMNAAEYDRLIKELKEAEVLYIDDFLKCKSGEVPTASDINIAFEIINYRYNQKKALTIISTERTMRELLEIDEAVGSRIYERAGEYVLSIKRDFKNNYRLRGLE